MVELREHREADISVVVNQTDHVYTLTVAGTTMSGTVYEVCIAEQVPDAQASYNRPLLAHAYNGVGPICTVGVKKMGDPGSFDGDDDIPAGWFDGASVEPTTAKDLLTGQLSGLTDRLRAYAPSASFGDVQTTPLPPGYDASGCITIAQLPKGTPGIDVIHMKLALVQGYAQHLGFEIEQVHFETGR